MPIRSAVTAILLSVFSSAGATPLIAKFSTVLGDFDVLLQESAAPVSVGNFTTYANSGRYDSTIIHRSTTYNPATIQIVQGGGVLLSGNQLLSVSTDAPIALEAGLANSRGTLAMARTSEINSATSQWFFNVTDSPGLDGGYAVFGRIFGSGGLSVLDAMASVRVYNVSSNLGSAVFAELPLMQPSLDPSSLLLVRTVAAMPFRITGVQTVANGVKIDWTALSTNTSVRVERTTNLATGNWQAVSSNNIEATFTDTNAPVGAAYYRVVAE